MNQNSQADRMNTPPRASSSPGHHSVLAEMVWIVAQWCAPLVLATFIVLLGYTVLALTGCSLLSCGANATNGAAAGGCQAGTRF
jgi:hypothetical protein